MGETAKTKARWIKNGIYDRLIVGKSGIDIGVGRLESISGADTINPDFVQHDKDICDATYMDAYEDNSFDVVWSSHVLEHLFDPISAIQNWVRICKPEGIIVILVPDAILYEGVFMLPSMWNHDHKTMWLAFDFAPPNTFSLYHTVKKAIEPLECADILTVETCDENWSKPSQMEHASGEYQIQCIIKKRA
jgi:SAM-dependent methyltransferase